MKNSIFMLICAILFANSSLVLAGNADAGKSRYAQNCGNCHGPGGMGLASYPKISGKEVAYLVDRLQTYRSGQKIGPNSSLMIMMAMPLTDEEIANLAAYLSSVQN